MAREAALTVTSGSTSAAGDFVPPASPILTARLRDSWDANATAWTAAVREQRIPSRRAGTDAAIEQAAALPAPGVRYATVSYETLIADAKAVAGPWELITLDPTPPVRELPGRLRWAPAAQWLL